MPDKPDHDPERDPNSPDPPEQRVLLHRILRYVPSLLSDDGVNIGVLLYDPSTGERRLRVAEGPNELSRLRRLRPPFDEEWLRGLPGHLESRLGAGSRSNGNGGPVRSTLRNGHGNPTPDATDWLQIVEKWDATLSQSLQLADPKATTAADMNDELDRLYNERVAVAAATGPARPSRPNSRPDMRRYCEQVFRQAHIWDRIQKAVRLDEFTFPGDPMRIDYSYSRDNHKRRGFIQTISLTRDPGDARLFAYAADHIMRLAPFASEFTAVTDIELDPAKDSHGFVSKACQEFDITPIPLDNFAVWVAKLRPMVQ
jgi:hypothetical protein